MRNTHKDMQETEKGILVHYWRKSKLAIVMENGIGFP